MKILIFNWQDIRNPLGGGAEVHLHEIFSRIARDGHDVTLFCSAFDGAPPEEDIDGIRIIRQGSRNTFNAHVPLAYRTRFRHETYDVVVDDINKIPFYTPLFVRRPLVAVIHHLFGSSIFREVSFAPALYVYVSEIFVPRVYRHTPMVAVSESTRKDLTRKGFPRESISLVYNCVDHHVYRSNPALRSRTPLVAYLGRLKRYKSIDHFLRAFAVLRQRMPDVRGVVVGDGDDRPRLERLADALRLGESLHFTGFVALDEKIAWLQRAWCIVNPSSKEGWGLTVLEANACGTPCIASRVPGLVDSVVENETGLFYEYGDILQLANRMIELLTDSKLRESLSSGAKQWALRFDWNEQAARMLEVLERAVDSRSRKSVGSLP